MNDFEKWWYEIGSGIGALPNHDHEEHAMRISRLAWEAANKQICKERDEARREVCELENLDWIGSVCCKGIKETARLRGWDCYKKEETK